MQSLVRDLRIGFRGLLRAPGFAIVAILTMALGVGATSAIFSIVNGVLLNGLPWKDPETIVSFELRDQARGTGSRDATPAQYRDFKQQLHAFEDLAALRWEQAYLTDRDEARLTVVPRVTVNAMQLFGIRPLHGRVFGAHDGEPGAQPVAMLSERLWRERYGAAPGLIGRTVEINGDPVSVIGIVPSSQWFPYPYAEALRPLDMSPPAPSRTDDRLAILGRLARGTTLAQAQTQTDVVMDRLAQQHPETDANLRARLLLTRDRIADAGGRGGIGLLMGAVGFVLLIVCANLANLLLSRSATREREIATRAALGATRGRIVAQLLAECAAIGLLALPLALLVTRWSLDYFMSLVPPSGQWMDQFYRFDRNVLLFAVTIAGVAVLLSGLSPALRASKLDLNSSLKEGGSRGTTAGSQRLRSTLVVLQIGLALALLVVASLFMQSFTKLHQVEVGFPLDGVVASSGTLPDTRYRDPVKLRAFYRVLTDTLRGLPGDVQAAVASSAPLDWDGPSRDFDIAGRPALSGTEAPRARWSAVSPKYFGTLGLHVQVGRVFTDSDDENAEAVAVVTRSLADEYFPELNPVGQRIGLRPLRGALAVGGGSRVIVGVVSDVKSIGSTARPTVEPRIYEPLAQQPGIDFSIVVRQRGDDALAVGPLLRERLARIDSRLGLGQVETMHARFERALWQVNSFVTLMGALGALAFLLAAVGIYGVVSYTTASRFHEFGIRAALGAEPRALAVLVLRKTLVLAGLGVSLGLLLALALGRGIQSLLYETSGTDPLTLVSVSLAITVVAILASTGPILRATRTEPMDCLRVE